MKNISYKYNIANRNSTSFPLAYHSTTWRTYGNMGLVQENDNRVDRVVRYNKTSE